MSNIDYWKKVCNEYEVALQVEKDKVKDLKERLFYYEFKDNSQMVIDLIYEIENKKMELIIVLLKNGERLPINPQQVKVDNNEDNYLQLIKTTRNERIIYKLDTDEITGIKLYQKK